MKKICKPLVLACVGIVFTAMLVFAGACGSTKKAALHLDAGDGGTLEETEFSVKVGADLNKFLKGKEPEPLEGLTFAGWFNGGFKLASDATMPEGGMSLTAKYGVSYTVNLYISDNYGVYPEVPSVTKGQAFYHEPFTPQVQAAPEHFELDPDKENVLSTTSLEPNAVFNIWYRREPIVVSYRANAPAGVEIGGMVPSVELEYNGTLTVSKCLFTAPANYRFIGWTTSSDGTGDRYFGGDTVENVTEGFPLFANWERGYTDLFGGDDVIFLPSDEENAAILVRGGVEFEGTLSADGGFSFGTDENKLEGKLGENYTFSYFRSEQAGEYSLYDAHLGASSVADKDVVLTLDGFGGATYSYKDKEGATVTSTGSYFPIGGTDFRLELEDGQTYTFALGLAGDDPVFSFYDGAEGTYLEAVAGSVSGVSLGENYLTFDGLGLATLVDYTNREVYYGLYAIESVASDGTMFLIRAEIEGAGEMYFFTLTAEGRRIYLVRGDEAGEYEAKDDSGATLSLDGFAVLGDSAVLTEKKKETAGPYWLRESVRFGKIVDLYMEEGGNLVRVASYLINVEDKTFELFEEDVAEYMRLVLSDEGSATPGYPMLILYSEAYGGDAPEGALKADLYDMGASDAAERIASGYYTTKVLGKDIIYYTLVVTQTESGYAGKVWQSVEFLTGMVGLSDGGYLDVYYTFYIDKEPTFTLATEAGKSGEEAGKLWISSVGVSGMGGLYFEGSGNVYEGSYAPVSVEGEEGAQYYTFTTYVPDETSDVGYVAKEYYFCVTEKDGAYTYTRLDEMPTETASIFYYIDKYGEQAEDNGGLLVFLGENTAMYIKGGTEGDLYFGAYTDTGTKTKWGNKIYTFTPNEQSGGDGSSYLPDPIEPFNFIYEIASGTGTGTFYIYDETLNGTLSSENGAKLELDGFFFRATYTNSYGEVFDGYYILYDDTTIWFRDGETLEEYRFPITAEGFRDVDEDAGISFAEKYAIVDDSGLSVTGYKDYTLSFAADGTVSLFNASNVLVSEGSWTQSDEEAVFAIEIEVLSGDTLKWTVKLDSASGLCIVHNDAAEGVYTSGDRTVLLLDGWGGGAYFDFYGVSSSVETVRVSTEYVVVAEAGGAWEFFAAIDGEHNTFLRIDNSAEYAAFYTKDLLHSVVFSDVLYVDGQAFGYYLVNEEGAKATVYKKNGASFGTVELDFPAAADETYTYADKTYYRYNGETIAFQGQIVFEDRDAVDVSLTLTSAGLELFPAAASIAQGDDEPLGGYTVTSSGGLILSDTLGATYSLTLSWDPDNAANNKVTINGEFIYYQAIYDAEVSSANMVYFGYFGVGELKVGEDLWYFDFEDAKDTKGNILRSLTENAPWEMDSIGSSDAHGNLYAFELTGEDDELYYVQYFLVDGSYNAWKENSQTLPYMLIYSIDLCRTLTYTDGGSEYKLEIEQCYFNNSFKDSFAVGDLLGANLFVGETMVEADYTESGTTLTWKTAEWTYTVSLTLDEDGFATSFTVTKNAASAA